MTLDWQRATEVAQSITAQWQGEGKPGGAIVLFDSNQLRALSCGGQADLAQGTPFSADSVVRFASVTKHLFASLVTVPLADVIALDDRLAQHLPQLRGPRGQVTVGQALDMTSGLHDLRETLSLLGLSAGGGGAESQGHFFAERLQQHICQPLDIYLWAPKTWFDIVPGLVPGYRHSDSGWQLASAGLHLSASGSVLNLSIWLQTLLRDEGPRVAGYWRA